MKKILFYLLAAGALFSVGCSKDAGVDTPVVEGKYTLSEISFENSDQDAETRTGLGTGNVVNWSTKDRILIVNTVTGQNEQYVLVSGAGTPIGTFRPVVENAPIQYDSEDDIKAVYPAVAATVSGSGTNTKISVSINQNYLENNGQTWLDTYGITSYTSDSQFAFTHNDIKVSYKVTDGTLATNDATKRPNFKFKQLGVWCTARFDFTESSVFSRDKMLSMAIESSNVISGTAEIDFADPMAPALKYGTATTDNKKIEWNFATVSTMAAPFTRSFMMFPNVKKGDKLTITAKADGHNYYFYAAPTADFAAGSTKNLPLALANFEQGNEGEDTAGTYFAESTTTPGNEFYYYGNTNCYVAWNTVIATNYRVDIDITAHAANRFYEQVPDQNGNLSTAANAPQVKGAKWIWYENTLTIVGDPQISGNLVKVTVSGAGNGVVGIYSDTQCKNLLWSYHVWRPEHDPRTGLLDYKVTNSTSYKVMPMALGATKKTTNANTVDEKLASVGLYYQWGRKDPLGRPKGWATGNNGYVPVTVTDAEYTGDADAFWSSASNIRELAETDILASYDEDNDGPLDAYMVKWAVKNPTVFVKVASSGNSYNNDWVGVTNNNLWGNPEGYNYPEQSQLPGRSVFDPCPAGYRVAPKDLWINFTETRANVSNDPDKYNVSNYVNNTSISTDRGYSFYYQQWKAGLEDFYPASGNRNRETGALNVVGTYGYAWSSSPYAAGNANGGFLYFSSGDVYPLNGTYRANAFPVRCVQNQ